MKNKFRALLTAAAIGVGSLTAAVVAEPVSAAPSHCAVAHSSSVASASCWGGTGRFRVVAWSTAGTVRGSCTPIGYISRAYGRNLIGASWVAC